MSFDNDDFGELSGAGLGPEPADIVDRFTSAFDPARLAPLDPRLVVAALGTRVDQHHENIRIWRDWLDRFEAALDERSGRE